MAQNIRTAADFTFSAGGRAMIQIRDNRVSLSAEQHRSGYGSDQYDKAAELEPAEALALAASLRAAALRALKEKAE